MWSEYKAKEGRPDAGRVSATRNRKFLTVTSRKEGATREFQQTLASHLSHSISTADTHYAVGVNIAAAKKSSKYITKLLVRKKISDSDECKYLYLVNCCPLVIAI